MVSVSIDSTSRLPTYKHSFWLHLHVSLRISSWTILFGIFGCTPLCRAPPVSHFLTSLCASVILSLACPSNAPYSLVLKLIISLQPFSTCGFLLSAMSVFQDFSQWDHITSLIVALSIVSFFGVAILVFLVLSHKQRIRQRRTRQIKASARKGTCKQTSSLLRSHC